MVSSLTLNKSKKVANWILNGISYEITKPFDTNLKTTMSNLANGRVILKFNNSVLLQKKFSLWYSNFILNLHIVYELNKWPLKNSLFGTVKLVRNAIF